MRFLKLASLAMVAFLSFNVYADDLLPGFPEAQESETIPCPHGWKVESNPSVENSLSYMHESGKLAVNISYIAKSAGQNVMPEAYARVAAQQMNCEVPVISNLIDHAWSFYCSDIGVEGVVYGPSGDLVLLSISGRNDKTEPALEDFVRFLEDQAKR